MAIQLITGVPRSGKTYYAVDFILSTLCSSDPQKKPSRMIISNIDNLQIDHLPLDFCIRESGLIPAKFFTQAYQERIYKKYGNVFYVLDEFHQIFNNKFFDAETFSFFSLHGHYGFDFFLLTQNINLCPRNISLLAEFEIRAVPRSASFGKTMILNKIVAGQNIEKIIRRPSKKIFSLYQSRTHTEGIKYRNPVVKILLVLVALLVGGLWWAKNHMLHGGFLGASQSIASDLPGVKKLSSRSRSTLKNEMPISSDLVPIRLSYYYIGSDLYIIDDGVVFSAVDYPYPARIQTTRRGLAITVMRPKPQTTTNLEKD